MMKAGKIGYKIGKMLGEAAIQEGQVCPDPQSPSLTSESRNACCEAWSAASRAISSSVWSEVNELWEPWLEVIAYQASVRLVYCAAIKRHLTCLGTFLAPDG